eukprot:10264043-Alexandrium_andersonii.AAC.1
MPRCSRRRMFVEKVSAPLQLGAVELRRELKVHPGGAARLGTSCLSILGRLTWTFRLHQSVLRGGLPIRR